MYRVNSLARLMRYIVLAYCVFIHLFISYAMAEENLNNSANNHSSQLSAKELHFKAWDRIVSSSDIRDQLGLYASRSLAVKYPHIYLKADLLFIQEVMKIKGVDRLYKADIRAGQDVYAIPIKEGKGFNFDLVNFENYQICKYKDIYRFIFGEKEYENSLSDIILPYFDRRVLPIKSTLKLYELNGKIDEGFKLITPLELSFIHYVQLRLTKGFESDDLFIMYFEDEDSCIYDLKNDIILDNNGDEISRDTIRKKPIFIINEEETFYPLLGIGPEKVSRSMQIVIDKFDWSKPDLISYEKDLLTSLNWIVDLNSSDDLSDLALLLSTHNVFPSFSGSIFSQKWENILTAHFSRIHLSKSSKWKISQCIVLDILKSANLLSPIVTYLAIQPNLEQVSERWLELTATYDDKKRYKNTRGHLWLCGFVEYSIDETLRTRAGHCVTQSTNLYSVLEFKHHFQKGKKPLQFQLSSINSSRGPYKLTAVGSHHVVMEMNPDSPFNSTLFDDGVARELYELFLPQRDNRIQGFRNLLYLASTDGWSYIEISRRSKRGINYFGTMSNSAMIEFINMYFDFEKLHQEIKTKEISYNKNKYDRYRLEDYFNKGIFGIEYVTSQKTKNAIPIPIEREQVLNAFHAKEPFSVDLNRLRPRNVRYMR